MANDPLSPHLAQNTVQQNAGQKVLWDKNERGNEEGAEGSRGGRLKEMDWTGWACEVKRWKQGKDR